MQRIVVGVDGSEGAARALRWAVEEAALRGAKVQAVQAWHIPYLDLGAYVPTLDPAVFEEGARKVLDEAVEAVDSSAMAAPIERVIRQGTAGMVLIDAAKGADLLVVG